MGTVYLVSCVGEKTSAPSAARDLYTSAWFKKARHYVEQKGSPWFILSAQYGLVRPDQVIAPYEKTLNSMPIAARRDWARQVTAQLRAESPQIDRVVFLAGERYREFLIPWLREQNVSVEVPMQGLGIGEQLSWLGATTDRASDLQHFYTLLERLRSRLQGTRLFAQGLRGINWPARGVYFFFEPGEYRSTNGLRIVRVGTHALIAGSKSTLRKRLVQHRGTSSGGGNHRGSIFRLLVGEALKCTGQFQEAASWGVGSDPSSAAARLGISREQILSCERPLELAVSARIAAMHFLWLNVDDEPGPHSNRGIIERNSIALLSNHHKTSLDLPSADWLGNHCMRERVRSSGLWNNKHVEEQYDPAFLSLLERHINSIKPL